MDDLVHCLDEIDGGLAALESELCGSTPSELPRLLDASIDLVKRMMVAYMEAEGTKEAPDPGSDILEVWKALVKGDPTWNTIRDNCRELVYYRNCLELDRADALPAVPQKMAVRTARHVYLYIRTRCLREGRVSH